MIVYAKRFKNISNRHNQNLNSLSTAYSLPNADEKQVRDYVSPVIRSHTSNPTFTRCNLFCAQALFQGSH